MVETDAGETYRSKYLVTALGLVSATNVPHFKGEETFAGEKYHTGAWPEDVTLAGKRVGVIGTGSTGLQVITAIAIVSGDHSSIRRHSISPGAGATTRIVRDLVAHHVPDKLVQQ